MSGFESLLNAYLLAHEGILPPVEPGEEIKFVRDGMEWKVSARNGGEVYTATIDCEDLMGWLWLQQSSVMLDRNKDL